MQLYPLQLYPATLPCNSTLQLYKTFPGVELRVAGGAFGVTHRDGSKDSPRGPPGGSGRTAWQPCSKGGNL